MFEKEVVIDGKGHLMGRLASVVAKQILSGQRVVVVRTEGIEIGGNIFRAHLKFRDFMNKTRNANPRKAHIHYHSPARMFWRCVRGMVPHKTARGAEALGRFKVFEGIPHPYDEKKKLVCPDALKTLRIKNFRKTTILGELATKNGWTKAAIVASLEEKRVVKAAVYYKSKKSTQITKDKAAAGSAEIKKINAELAKYGY